VDGAQAGATWNPSSGPSSLTSPPCRKERAQDGAPNKSHRKRRETLRELTKARHFHSRFVVVCQLADGVIVPLIDNSVAGCPVLVALFATGRGDVHSSHRPSCFLASILDDGISIPWKGTASAVPTKHTIENPRRYDATATEPEARVPRPCRAFCDRAGMFTHHTALPPTFLNPPPAYIPGLLTSRPALARRGLPGPNRTTMPA